ncbi:hypothetical protein GCM10008941_06390 [Rhizomicrobium palustre]
MEALGFHILEGIENDVLFPEYGAARNEDTGVGLLQKRADDVQRVGQYLQLEMTEMWAHLQGGAAAIDDHRIAMPTELGGGAANGFFFGAVAVDVLVKWHTLKMRPVRLRRVGSELCSTTDPDQLARFLETLQIAPQGGRRSR